MGTTIALTIAGSDSGGGAGIQADLKTFHQFGVFGTSALVAVTAQNTLGVHAIHTVPAEMVTAQLEAVASDLPPEAVKTGMLATADLVRLVASAIAGYGWRRYVLDPVMVATSGDRLLTAEAVDQVRSLLLPLAAVATPNLNEAELLTGLPVRTEAEMAVAGRRLLALGAGAALVKGGHLAGDDLVDLLVTPDGVLRFAHRRIATRSTHGTGCTLSAALAAGLALGRPLAEAARDALDYVARAIAAAPDVGTGSGPIDHTVAAITPTISRATRSPT